MKILNLKQNTPEWLEYRRHGIGASDAPSIMGVGFKTPYELYINKITGKEVIVNAAMQRGKDLEPLARSAFISMTGIDMLPEMVCSIDREWQFASLDGLSLDKKYFVEIKCPGSKDHESALNGQIPEKYYPQLQHQFSVTGLEKGFYFSFDGKDGVVMEIQRDDIYIKQLIEKELEFYERIFNFDPPQLTKEDTIILQDEEWDLVCEEYKRIKSNQDHFKEKESLLRERLISIAAERNVYGSGVRLTKILKKGDVDYKTLIKDKNIDVEKYRKAPTEQWRLSVDKDNFKSH